ncbi:MAG TPA: N-acetyl-gamma-glutamyl-phosphate reductase [Candidatus Eisenbacteria bacterium]|nr:N-acetyl-gamma-glutamyl-phosphate reductase [Candidatus Eisenbacteria bacterium]
MAGTKPVPVAVLGATGYVGAELLRVLSRHPGITLAFVSSEQYRGKRASDVYPALLGYADLVLEAPDPAAAAAKADVVFTALPHGASAPIVAALRRVGKIVIDQSADFRLRNVADYAKWYGDHHVAPELIREAVYGIPEIYREPLRSTKLVAVPGCYPTCALLGLVPLVRAGLVCDPVVIDAKSGTTGAGRAAKVEQLFAEVNENFRPYGVDGHRHGVEIDQELRAAGAPHGALFIPHLLPISRGMECTMYVRVASEPPLARLFQDAYAREPFVVLRGAEPPTLREVRGTNRCAISWRYDASTGYAVVMTALDNLGKGAAGNAVQCMNIVLGLPETAGLDAAALVP